MKYMGSKARLMKYIKPVIESFITDDTVAYVDPFAGGMNSICKIDFHTRIANDSNKYLIAMWNALQDGKRFNHFCNKSEYDKLRLQYRGISDFGFSDSEIGWYGFVASFNGRFFDGGYSGISNGRDYIGESSRNIENQIAEIDNVKINSGCYTDLFIPDNSVVYCDIPYKDTTQYGDNANFDYDQFYKWSISKSKKNTILISEFNMPKDRFRCVWEKKIKTQIGLENKHDKVERIFVPI
jgi:DNA adenine methylase